MKKDLKLTGGYLWGAGLSAIFTLLATTTPLKLLFIFLIVHPIIMIGIILIRRKLESSNT